MTNSCVYEADAVIIRNLRDAKELSSRDARLGPRSGAALHKNYGSRSCCARTTRRLISKGTAFQACVQTVDRSARRSVCKVSFRMSASPRPFRLHPDSHHYQADCSITGPNCRLSGCWDWRITCVLQLRVHRRRRPTTPS